MLKRKENFKCYGIKTRPAKNRQVLFSYKRGGHWDFRFCGFGDFLDRFFGFCAKRLRFFGFGVPCGLRLFRFLASGVRFLVEVTSSFSVLYPMRFLGFTILSYLRFSVLP